MSAPNQEADPLLRVLGPLSMSTFSAIVAALPSGTYVRGAGAVEHRGQTRTVFEFMECAIQESNDGKTWKGVAE